MQHQPSAKMLEAAITLKPDAFLIQNLSLRDSIAGSKFKQFLELIQPTLINRDAKNEYLGKVGVASRGAQTSENPVVVPLCVRSPCSSCIPTTSTISTFLEMGLHRSSSGHGLPYTSASIQHAHEIIDSKNPDKIGANMTVSYASTIPAKTH